MNAKRAKDLRRKAKMIAQKNGIKDWERVYKQAKKLVKAGLVMVMLLLTRNAGADELIIGRDCQPKNLQIQFALRGYQLDLDGNDRDENSWGFLKNEGNQFKIYTYKSVDTRELAMVREVVNGQ